MIDIPVYSRTGTTSTTLSIDESKLGGNVRPTLLKQAYVMFHANRRQGSARTRGRGDVDGSTRKLYRQKGSGNARMGTIRTGLRRGGGVTFAKTRTHKDFRKRMPRAMRRLANRNALLSKLIDNEVRCVEDLGFDAPSSCEFRKLIEVLGIDRTCLVALDPANRQAALSARNLSDVDTIRIDQLNVFELLNHRYLVVDRASLEAYIDGPSDAPGDADTRKDG